MVNGTSNGTISENTETTTEATVAPVVKTAADIQADKDMARWQLTGIRAERVELEQRLTYLREREQSLSGIAQVGTDKPASVGGRKRIITEEQRKAMSDAALRRWGKTPAAPGTEAAPAAKPTRNRRNRSARPSVTAPAAPPVS